MRNWSDLTQSEQLALRLQYQAALDDAPRTCSMDEKVARFADWLAGHGVAFAVQDARTKT